MLAQLESKILDLQAQIQATQEQITDYQTNPSYKQTRIYCKWCAKNVTTLISHNSACPCRSGGANWIRYCTTTTTINTKTAELAQAQAQLAQYIARAMILNQAFVSSPPPKQKYPQPKSA